MRIVFAGESRNGSERLGYFFQQGLALLVHLLQIYARRGCVHQCPPTVSPLAAQLTRYRRQLPRPFFQISIQRVQIIREVRMNEFHLRVQGLSRGNRLRQVKLQRLMVTAIHEQQLICGSIFFGISQFAVPEFTRSGLVHRNLIPVRIPVSKKNTENPRAIRPFPDQLGERGLIPPVRYGIVKACRFNASAEKGILNA
ncbi:hypothetical protein D3C81_1317850 [compost metagenome]